MCIINRARVQFLLRPDLPITGFAALAYYGLTTLVNGQEVVVGVRDRSTGRCENSALCRREIIPECELRAMDPVHPELLCVEPVEALISALKALRREQASWFVHDVPGLSWIDVRAIQLVDAVRRKFREEDVCALTEERSTGRIDRRWLRKILKLSDGGADSPMETVMRLIVRDLSIDGVACQWEAQVALYRGTLAEDIKVPDSQQAEAQSQQPAEVQNQQPDKAQNRSQAGAHRGSAREEWADDEGPYWRKRWLTVVDQLCRRFGIVLFFDGAHHREQLQHHKDTDIDAILQANGFLVLRVTEPMLREPEVLRGRIAALVKARQQNAE